MEPYTKKTNGREFGNAAAAADICGIKWETYQWYVRTGRPEGNPAPGPDHVDNTNRQSMYALRAVREWNKNRPGRGNWNGEGAAARRKHGPDDLSWCPVCRHRKGVRADGKIRDHASPRRLAGEPERCPGSGEAPTAPPVIDGGEGGDGVGDGTPADPAADEETAEILADPATMDAIGEARAEQVEA